MYQPDFDWTSDNSDVVVPVADPIAVYTNHFGAITIRAQAAWDESEDRIITFPPACAEAVARAILQEAGVVCAAPAREAQERTASSGAERQRRYRERHRNGVKVAAPRNAAGDGTVDVTRDIGIVTPPLDLAS